MINTFDADHLKASCPMPALLRRLGLGQHAKSSCRSPFREDNSPSWGIFTHGGSWFFKDHATGESGDEFSLLARLKGLDVNRDFPQLLTLYAELAGQPIGSAKASLLHPLPDRRGFAVGTAAQMSKLANARPYGLEGLVWASTRGLLVFGSWHGQECYGVTDSTGRVLEIRRIDGEPFPAVPSLGVSEHKSHAVRNSQKKWPLGIQEARDYPTIALVEGIPDLLEAHYLALWEQASGHDSQDARCAPVAMLSASPSIADEAIAHFRGKRVRIFGHADDDGQRGSKKWAKQLHRVAEKVELFDFDGLHKATGEPAKDLYDLRSLDPGEYLKSDLWKLLP